jgi:hypothetical protein
MPGDDLHCSSCGLTFAEADRAAGISGRIMGDTCTDIYYWCGKCAVFTIRLYRDAFCGPDSSSDSSPIPKEEGERRVALFRRCPDPSDERCRCDAHREYFGGALD